MTKQSLSPTLKIVLILSYLVKRYRFNTLMNTNKWLRCALVLSAMLVSALHARVELVDEGPAHSRLEYRPDSQQAREAGSTFLVGVPPESQVEIARVEAFAADGRRLDIGDANDWVSIAGDGMARRQRVVELAFEPLVRDDKSTPIERLVVDLVYTGDAVANLSKNAPRDPFAESYYSQVISNYQQAAQWRLPRAPERVAKTVQSTGRWLRVIVGESGMYRITGEDLEAAGIALADVDPKTLRLLYGGGQALSLSSIGGPSDWREMGLVVEDGGDGRFDAEDYILFYGEAAQRWEYDSRTRSYAWRENLYTEDNAYWVAFAGNVEGERESVRSGALVHAEAERPTSYRVRLHSEDEQFILYQTFGIKSGYTWYGEDFRGNARNFRVLVRDAVDEPVDIRLGFIGIGGNLSRFNVRWNGVDVGAVSFNSATRVVRALETAAGPVEGLNELGLFHGGDPTRFDWYELEYSRGFSAERSRLDFTSPVVNAVAEYALQGFDGEIPRIFEVSDRLVEIRDFAYDETEGRVVFQDEALSVPGHYIVGGESTWLRPQSVVEDLPSQLASTNNAADYIVIYHRDFADAAERLTAWRGQDDRWGPPPVALAVDIQDVYDEFSGGLLDPAALRNFFAYAEKNWQRAPMFALLLGDGSYDYKNNSTTSLGNWIPPYQDGDSTYDEWYVRITGNDQLPDMAIGRIPVQTAAEADRVIDKIIRYDSQPERGIWQSRALLVADDISNPDHPLNAETFFLTDSEYMAHSAFPPGINIDKLYLAQFPLEGRIKPRARDEFIRRFNDGALILTYLGHGNPDVLAHEQMFRVSRDIGEIANGDRLPFFYTAASQVGVFDDPVKTSMPEELLKLPNGGVVGMISATRVGFHLSNVLLAAAFHRQMYRQGRDDVPVGLAFMVAKQIARAEINTSDQVSLRNMQRYSLFGDPLQRLDLPRYQVELEIDRPLSALGLVEVSGRVLDETGAPADSYSGQVWLQVFDSAELSLLDGLRYRQVGTYLFRGRYPVVNGRFSGQFRVPKYFSSGGKNGRISAYAWSSEAPAAQGALEGLVLEGTAANVELDTEGPQIRIGFVGVDDFSSGDRVTGRPVLRAVISDPSGINITGETGHDIELAIGDEVFTLTEFFNVLEGDYREGSVEFSLPALELGEHSIRLKAWDTFNNSSRVEAVFELAEEGVSPIQNVLFYPNPLHSGSGYFTYDVAGEMSSAQIKVFSLGGRLVDEMTAEIREGYNQILWQAPTNLANGTYLYKIEAETAAGDRVGQTAVLQIAR